MIIVLTFSEEFCIELSRIRDEFTTTLHHIKVGSAGKEI